MTHPFLCSELPISCSQQGIQRRSTHQHTHTLSAWDRLTLCAFTPARTLSNPQFFLFPPSLFLTFSPSLSLSLSIFSSLPYSQEAPQDAECEWSGNDRTMGSRLSPRPHTHTPIYMRTCKRSWRLEAMEKQGVSVNRMSCFHIESTCPPDRGLGWQVGRHTSYSISPFFKYGAQLVAMVLISRCAFQQQARGPWLKWQLRPLVQGVNSRFWGPLF